MRTTQSHRQLAPEAYEILLKMYRHIHACGLEESLLHLVDIRSAQLNGCAYCVNMHSSEALESGLDPRRLNLLTVWREAPCFTPRERAALAWTEAVTQLGQHQVTQALYDATRLHFTEAELVNLTHAVALANTWNRLGVAFLPDIVLEEVSA